MAKWYVEGEMLGGKADATATGLTVSLKPNEHGEKKRPGIPPAAYSISSVAAGSSENRGALFRRDL